MQSDINLGVVVRNGKLIAQVSEENCEWIKILIRELGGEWKEHKLEPHPLYPTIFTATLDYDAKKLQMQIMNISLKVIGDISWMTVQDL